MTAIDTTNNPDDLSLKELSEAMGAARTKGDRLKSEARELHDRATRESRSLTAGESTRFDNLLEGASKATADADRFRAAWQARVEAGLDSGALGLGGRGDGSDLTYANSNGTGSSFAGDVFGRSAGDAETIAHRRVEELHRSAALDDQAADAVTGLVRESRPEAGLGRNLAADWAVVASDLAYRQAFAKIVQDPTRGHLEWSSTEHQAYQRAQTLSRAMSLTDTAGGHLIPLTLDPAIHLTGTGSISPIRRIARNVNTMTDTWKGITSAGTTAEWKAEGAEVADGTFAIAGPEIPVHLYDVFVPFSVEVQLDALDFEAQIRMVMMDAVDQLHAAAWVNGTGSGQPTGIITALDGGASEVSPSVAEAFNADADVYLVAEALRPRSKARAQWIAADSTINLIAQAETTNGARLFDGIESGTLLRKPLHEDSNMDQASAINPAATADNHVLLYGDPSEYVIANRVGSRVELVPHLFNTANNLPELRRGFVLWGRVGADVLVDQAFAVLNCVTAA